MSWYAEFTPEGKAAFRMFVREIADLANFTKKEAGRILGAFRRGIAYNFLRESTPDGQPWKPLKRTTEYIRALGIDERGVPFITGAKHPILRRTGALMGSFTDEHHPQHRSIVRQEHSGTTIWMWAEDVPDSPGRIALLHEGGIVTRHIQGQERELHIPARPWIGLSGKFQDVLFDEAFEIVEEKLGN